MDFLVDIVDGCVKCENVNELHQKEARVLRQI